MDLEIILGIIQQIDFGQGWEFLAGCVKTGIGLLAFIYFAINNHSSKRLGLRVDTQGEAIKHWAKEIAKRDDRIELLEKTVKTRGGTIQELERKEETLTREVEALEIEVKRLSELTIFATGEKAELAKELGEAKKTIARLQASTPLGKMHNVLDKMIANGDEAKEEGHGSGFE
jgi:predicted RNase H-like nuclease (RuvC/YqgF family)